MTQTATKEETRLRELAESAAREEARQKEMAEAAIREETRQKELTAQAAAKEEIRKIEQARVTEAYKRIKQVDEPQERMAFDRVNLQLKIERIEAALKTAASERRSAIINLFVSGLQHVFATLLALSFFTPPLAPIGIVIGGIALCGAILVGLNPENPFLKLLTLFFPITSMMYAITDVRKTSQNCNLTKSYLNKANLELAKPNLRDKNLLPYSGARIMTSIGANNKDCSVNSQVEVGSTFRSVEDSKNPSSPGLFAPGRGQVDSDDGSGLDPEHNYQYARI